MVLFPPAKINLGLHVLGKRPDGYHALESIFLPLAWTDILEVVVDPHVAAGDMKTTFTGLPIPGASDDNLVVKAHRILARPFPWAAAWAAAARTARMPSGHQRRCDLHLRKNSSDWCGQRTMGGAPLGFELPLGTDGGSWSPTQASTDGTNVWRAHASCHQRRVRTRLVPAQNLLAHAARTRASPGHCPDLRPGDAGLGGPWTGCGSCLLSQPC